MSATDDTPALIPLPASLERTPGNWILAPWTRLLIPAAAGHLAPAALRMRDDVSRLCGYTLPVLHTDDAPRASDIVLRAASATATGGDEGHTLSVRTDGATITAATVAGALHAAQTLCQLLPPAGDTRLRIASVPGGLPVPCVEIADAPRFPWRGMMLDCARHFMPVGFVRRFIDLMAMHKLNVFHWHLMDHNGWRMEVESFPRLLEVAAFRGVGACRDGGYYTKNDIRGIVAHAAERGITVVPEFEMPGHCDAALAAYPGLACTGCAAALPTEPAADDVEFFTRAGNRPFCAGNDDVFAFHLAVFDEALELFPSRVWHVGGDERPKGHWDKCPRCRARMAAHGLADEHALQEWFMRRISDELVARGKRPMSWAVTQTHPYNPTQLETLGNDAIIQNWHDCTRFATGGGWDVVDSHNCHYYFNYPQSRHPDKPDWMPRLPLRKVYAHDPVPAGLDPGQARRVLGPEGCLWSNLIPPDEVLPHVFPRLLALAESAWTPAVRKDFACFERRVEAARPRLEACGVAFWQPPVGVEDDGGDDAHILPMPAE